MLLSPQPTYEELKRHRRHAGNWRHELGPQPTYEELKRRLLRDKFGGLLGPQPTYEELKPGSPTAQTVDVKVSAAYL